MSKVFKITEMTCEIIRSDEIREAIEGVSISIGDNVAKFLFDTPLVLHDGDTLHFDYKLALPEAGEPE